ncbi:MAG: 2OG-Fe(II) oxygenase [Tahibacter sp.]
MPDIFCLNHFLETAECARLCAELRDSSASAATVLGTEGRRVEGQMRRAMTLQAAPTTVNAVRFRLERNRADMARYFAHPLGAIEAPQFLRYRKGDYFVAHQDGNTPLVRDASLHRKVSIVIFLNAPGGDEDREYSGGALVFHDSGDTRLQRLAYAPAIGTLLAFRSETTHEVLPVTGGNRYTVVSWYRDPTEPVND